MNTILLKDILLFSCFNDGLKSKVKHVGPKSPRGHNWVEIYSDGRGHMIHMITY